MASALGLRAGKIDDGMAMTLKGLTTPGELKKIMADNELNTEELEALRVNSGSVTLAGETAVTGNGATQSQAQMMMTTTQEVRKLAESNERLAAVVSLLEKKVQ
jgi:hypothetical protein